MDEWTDDEFDSLDDVNSPQNELQEVETIEDLEQENSDTEEQTNETNSDFTTSLLNSIGINDVNKIKFEEEDGSITERAWDDLTPQEQVNIIKSSTNSNAFTTNSDDDLDDDEVDIINQIREGGMTPKEYVEAIQKTAISNYLSTLEPQYAIDDYTDDELYVADIISKTNISQQEAIDALEKAKSNPSLYKKLIDATRELYKRVEDENKQYEQFERELQLKDQFQQFSDKIEDSINNFTEFGGYDLNMSSEDMQQLYDFITGKDSAGNYYFNKALNDPDTLVKMAWFALNGDLMINDINTYYKNEITSTRKESYKKGKEAKPRSTTIFKQTKSSSNTNNNINNLEIDDDFE